MSLTNGFGDHVTWRCGAKANNEPYLSGQRLLYTTDLQGITSSTFEATRKQGLVRQSKEQTCSPWALGDTLGSAGMAGLRGGFSPLIIGGGSDCLKSCDDAGHGFGTEAVIDLLQALGQRECGGWCGERSGRGDAIVSQ
jgi:hypothetical protein